MDLRHSILLSGFADEVTDDKNIDQQLAVAAALGLEYLTLRFVDVGGGIKNVMRLDADETQRLKHKLNDYSLKVSSIGSPLGKVKLREEPDGTSNIYRPFDDYVNNEVERACELAQILETTLIRGFSFYPPRHSPGAHVVTEVVERLSRMTAICDRHGLTYGLEVEANLVGCNGDILAEIHRRVDHPALVLVFDGGNLVTQGYSTSQIFEQYQVMKPGLGWLHIKDAKQPEPAAQPTYVAEELLSRFVPADRGDAGHDRIVADLASYLPELNKRMQSRGASGTFADMEPHLKRGGQFGGYSGPDGFGIALRSFCGLCQRAGVSFRLREFADLP